MIGKRNSIDLIRREISGRREVLVPWSYWNTRLQERFASLWGNLRLWRSAPIISVCLSICHLLCAWHFSFTLFMDVFNFHYSLSFLLRFWFACSFSSLRICSFACNDGAGTRRQWEVVCVARHGFCWWWIEGWAFLHSFWISWEWVQSVFFHS